MLILRWLGLVDQIVAHFLQLLLLEVQFLAHRFLPVILVQGELFNLVTQDLNLWDDGVEEVYDPDVHTIVHLHEPLADVLHVAVAQGYLCRTIL